MKRMTLGFSALLLVLAGAGFAAEEHPETPQPETRAEAQARAGALFDKLDLNHDGKLDEGDRALRVNQMFDRLDTNHDGSISRDEFAAAHMRQRGDDDVAHGHPGGDHMGHWGYGHRELGGLVMLVLHRADPEHVGTITRDAFVKAALSLFDQADTNHDGVLTPEEHRAAADAMRQQMQARRAGSRPGAGRDEFLPPPPGN